MTEQLTPELLLELKHQKLGDEAIGKRYGMSGTSVREMRLEHGIPSYYEIVNNIDVEKLAKLKRRGKTDVQCAEILGVSLTIIRKARREHNITAPKATNRPGLTKERAAKRMAKYIDRVHEMYANGLSYRHIGKKLNLPESTIRTWLNPEFKMSIERTRKSSNVEDNLRIIYDWIVAYKFEHDGNSPTQREIAEGTGHAKGYLNQLLIILEERGKISLPGDGRASSIVVHGAQWIPPTGWKRPARLRKRQKIARPRRRVDKETLMKEGRLCDCGNEAKWYINIEIGNVSGRKARKDTLPLCADCAEYEREQGTEVMAL